MGDRFSQQESGVSSEKLLKFIYSCKIRLNYFRGKLRGVCVSSVSLWIGAQSRAYL